MDVHAAYSLVLETLERAVSQNADVLKEAEQKLCEWESVPGFYSILQNIFSNYEIDYNVRMLAIVFCKNGIDKFWRKTAPNSLSEEEKATIRRGFLLDFREPMPHVGNQLAVLIAKVARYDCPHEWAELIPTLLEAVKSGDVLVQNRSVLILHRVIKNLSSKRLAGDKRMFQELAGNIFSFIFSLWDTHTHLCFLKTQEDIVEAKKYLENALLSLRILENLVIFGFKKPHESQDVNNFLKLIFQRAKTMLEIRLSIERRTADASVLPHNKNFVVTSEKYIYRLTSVLRSLLECHPFSFVDFIRPSLELAVYYAFTPNGESLIFERFLIQCFNLIKSIVLCSEYKPAKPIEETEFPETLKAHQIKQSFFDTTTLSAICRRIITHYFLLTPADLSLWESEPETFATDEGGESWKYSLRPCVETLFLTIFHEYRSSLAPVLVELITTNHNLVSPDNFNAILAKDAVYNAIGLAAFDMYDEVNFNDWFLTTLRDELAVRDSSYRILRRRIAWLLGKWTGVKLSSQLYPVLYSAMVPLLGSHEDHVVRLTAAATIKTVVDDFEFNTELFIEFLEPLFDALFQLLKEVEECDTKMRVLNVLYFIVERVGAAIEPHCDSLIQYLPLLWQESEHHNMLRCAVVATLVQLIKALGNVHTDRNSSWKAKIGEFVLMIISFSIDIKQDSHVYLLEDGLELWQVVLENLDQCTPKIMQLFNNMPGLMENNSEFLRTCICIIQAYILLSPEDFLQLYGEAVLKSCLDLLSDIKPEGVALIMKLLELCIKANASLSMNLLKPLLPYIFEHIYRGEEYQMIMIQYLSILSRVLLTSKDAFIEVINKVSIGVQKNPDEVLNTILDVWLNKMPLVSQLDRKKLLALALASLLTAQSGFVYEKFCGILLAVAEVLNDISRVDPASGEICDIDVLVYTGGGGEEFFDTFDQTEHEIRRRELSKNDPVHKVVLQAYMKSQLDELQRMVGAEKFKQFVETIDIETLEMIRQYGMLL